MNVSPTRLILAVLTLAMCTAAGCGEPLIDPDKTRRNANTGLGGQLAPDLPEQPNAKQDTPAPTTPSPSSTDADPNPAQSDPSQTPADPPQTPGTNVTRVPATPGVTGKGQYGPGLITTPVSTYFLTKERLVFEIKIPDAMRTFKVLNDRFPKSHEEFMKKIIKDNSIVLPTLRDAGARYVYLPEKAAKMKGYWDKTDPPLVVERPQPATQ